MRRIVKGLAVAAIVLVGGVATGALALPETSTVTRTASFAVPAAEVFARVTDVAGQPRWRSDVTEVTLAAGGAAWTERTRDGDAIAFRAVELVPGRRFVIAFESPRGFSGQWAGDFAERGGVTVLSVVETITIPSPVTRLIARVLAPPGSHTDLYLADLGRALERTR